jgi:hypothetical protein
MGYRDKTFRVELPELFEDCFVELLNPLLLDATLMEPAKDHDDAVRITKNLLADAIVAWNVLDRKTDELLALPSEDVSVLDRAPGHVWTKVQEALMQKRNPTLEKTEESPTTTSKS